MRLPDVWVYCYSIINWYGHGPQFVRESGVAWILTQIVDL